MNDREKVINDLQDAVNDDWMWQHADYYAKAMENALAMLKEQEPMQVKTDMYGNAYCPWCSTDVSIEMGAQRLHLGTQFCPYCGRPVKFE